MARFLVVVIVLSRRCEMYEQATGSETDQYQIHHCSDTSHWAKDSSRWIMHHETFPFSAPLRLLVWPVYR
jgi:hypothetical protein